MPLRLITGPANSGKAGIVLGAYRARLAEAPILVVPTFADVERSQRELAAAGAVLGAGVVRFGRLFEIVAERAAPSLSATRRLSAVERGLFVERALAETGDLPSLAASAARPGLVRAAVRLVSELERAMVAPRRLERAAALAADTGPSEPGPALAAITRAYSSYRALLERSRLEDDEGYAWRALDALRREPLRWGRTPLFLYGFDDFTPQELDLIETLTTRCEVDVTVSLPYERGRVAFRALAPTFERLAGLAAEHRELPPSDDHYADASREALHHLERGLFAEEPQRQDPGTAVRLLSSAGERAEVEQVAAHALEALGAGTEPGDVAVVFRDPGRYASVVEQVFGAYGVPHSIDRFAPLAATALGRALLALLRCAEPEATAEDLLAYLRHEGQLGDEGLVDALEARARKAGVETASGVRELWEEWGGSLGEIDGLRGAAGSVSLLDRVEHRLGRLFAGPHRRRAAILEEVEEEDARAFEAARTALEGLRAACLAGPAAVLTPRRVHDALAEVALPLGRGPVPDRVLVASPEALRARRFQVVFVCGLQEGELPRRPAPEPFISDDRRRELAAEGGLVLPVSGDGLDRERYLFYVCASRAERTLYLSSRSSDEDGSPEAASFLLEDVRELFSPALEESAGRRSLGDVTWPPEAAPSPTEWERALAARGPRKPAADPADVSSPELLDRLAARKVFSAGALEAYADCPVKWLVERLIEPDRLEPDPEPMVRGAFAHRVLELTFRRLPERTGSRRVTRQNLREAERILLEAMRECAPHFKLSPRAARVRAAVRRLEFDLLSFLRSEAESDTRFEPQELELSFGLDEESAVELQDAGASVRGRVDRVDVLDGHALVRDYKAGKRAHPVARWSEDNHLQVALYMLAVRERLGLELAGGVYVPLGGGGQQPRGLLAAELAEQLDSGFSKRDLLEREEFERALAEARARIGDLVSQMRSGRLRACPETCAWNGGCSYPSICREER